MATLKWATPETIQTALTTELNALANNGLSAASAAIDNLTDLYLYCEFELVLASLTPTGIPVVDLYIVKQIDGTNYEDNTVSAVHQVRVQFPMSTATAAKRIVVANVLIPPTAFKIIIGNRTGPAFGATGNTLKYRRYNEQSV